MRMFEVKSEKVGYNKVAQLYSIFLLNVSTGFTATTSAGKELHIDATRIADLVNTWLCDFNGMPAQFGSWGLIGEKVDVEIQDKSASCRWTFNFGSQRVSEATARKYLRSTPPPCPWPNSRLLMSPPTPRPQGRQNSASWEWTSKQ